MNTLKTLKYLLLLSAIIPATLLLGMCFLVIAKITSDGHFNSKDAQFLIIALLGITGYVGLIVTSLDQHNKHPRTVITTLLAGIISFVWFTSLGGKTAWNWVLTFNEPDEWFIYTWPTLVSIFFLIRVIVKLREKKEIE